MRYFVRSLIPVANNSLLERDAKSREWLKANQAYNNYLRSIVNEVDDRTLQLSDLLHDGVITKMSIDGRVGTMTVNMHGSPFRSLRESDIVIQFHGITACNVLEVALPDTIIATEIYVTSVGVITLSCLCTNGEYSVTCSHIAYEERKGRSSDEGPEKGTF